MVERNNLREAVKQGSCSSTEKEVIHLFIIQPPSLLLHSALSLLIRGRVHCCCHGDRSHRGGGPDAHRALYVC